MVYHRKYGPPPASCNVPGCGQLSQAKGLCGSHYWRLRTHGDPGGPIIRGKPTNVPCEIQGCTRLAIGDGLCRMHYERRRKGKPIGSAEPQRRPGGQGYLSKNGYIAISINRVLKLKQRVVMEEFLGRPLTKYKVVHHIDGNRQNNNISNLELWNKSHPPGQRVEDKLKWARNFIETYEGTQKQRVVKPDIWSGTIPSYQFDALLGYGS